MGNYGDARLIVYLNEHWFQVLRGSQSWRNPTFFYPAKDVLGYTDTFFLWQVVYAPLRALGSDPFLAFQLSIVALSLVGFVSFVVLVRVTLRASPTVAIVGALVFTFANNLAAHAGSPQLFGIYFVPPIMLLAVGAWRLRFRHPVRSAVLGALFGALTGLLLFSNYYVAWFSIVTTVLVAILFAVLGPRTVATDIAAAVRSGWRSLVAAAGGLAAGLVPFAATYLPVIGQVGPRHYRDAMMYSTRWTDVVNVSTGNLVWGNLAAHLPVPGRAGTYETSQAVTPILLATVLIGGAVLAWATATRRGENTRRVRAVLALCLAAAVLTVLPIDFSFGSPWIVLWHLPGAQAIRAIDRIEVANDLVVALAFVGLATEAAGLIVMRRRVPWLVAAAVLAATVVVEQVHNTSPSALDRPSQLAALASVPAPPPACTSFFVVTTPSATPFQATQTQAMLISQRTGLPTLNGYSGVWPPGWVLWFPQTATYLNYVQDWIEENRLRAGVCELDLSTRRWETNPLLP